MLICLMRNPERPKDIVSQDKGIVGLKNARKITDYVL